jgi:hypothetical protein
MSRVRATCSDTVSVISRYDCKLAANTIAQTFGLRGSWSP